VGAGAGDVVPEELGVGLPAAVGVEFEEEIEVVGVDATEDTLELEMGLPAAATTPPCTFPDVVVEEVPAAALLNAARVLPEEGGLTTPTIPP